MKRTINMLFVFYVMTLFLISGSSYAFSGFNDVTLKEKYKADEVLVKFKPGVQETVKKSAHDKLGSKKLRQFDALRIDHVKIKDGLSVEEAIAEYKNEPHVEYAQPNYWYRAEGVPNDPRFAELWSMNNTGQVAGPDPGTPDADIDAPEAWNLVTGSTTPVIAVIDTGVDYLHEDLGANMWKNPGEIPNNGLDDDGNGYVDDVYGIDAANGDSDPMDDYLHGTHVAGIIGAVGNNQRGIAGVNWNVKIMALKFLTASGSGSTAWAIKCLEYVRMMKSRGINIVATSNSWGNTANDLALSDAINAQRDILFFAAAGNYSASNDTGTYIAYPAAFKLPNIVAVAATDNNDKLASYSSYGRYSVHMAAPGSYILSTVPGNQYHVYSGTSMACPHVSGLAMLISARYPALDWRGIKNRILSGGDPIAAASGKTITGRRINAYGSLTVTNTPVFSVLQCPVNPPAGVPVTISALSIQGESAVGPVIATTRLQTMTLQDDGVAPDMAAGDGIFTGTWVPADEPFVTFSSPSGSEQFITKPFTIDTATLPGVTVGTPYSYALKTTGGEPPFTWSVLNGKLPEGLTLNSAAGIISGTPAKIGEFNFTIQATDGWLSPTRELVIQVYTETPLLMMPDAGYFRVTTVDASGNVYGAGSTPPADTTDVFDSADFMVAKYSPAGVLLWTRSLDFGSSNWVNAIDVDSKGNVTVSGYSQYLFYVGGFLTVKYDANGTLLWSHRFDPLFVYCNIYGVTTDANGYTYVVGGAELSLNGYATDYLTIKYDPSGNVVWSRYYGGSDPNLEPVLRFDEAMDAVVDPAGNVYVTGYSRVYYEYKNGGVPNCRTIKYDSSGNLLWERDYGLAKNQDVCTGIALDQQGDVYVTGHVANLDATESDALILKYDSNGNLLWERLHDGGGIDDGLRVVVGPSNNVYLTGYTQNSPRDSFMTVKYDPAGSFIWQKTTDVLFSDKGQDLVFGSNNVIYVSGVSKSDTAAYAVKITYQDSALPSDFEPPVVTAFDIPATSSSLTVPITAFTATDNLAVVAYLVTESSAKPEAADAGWTPSTPTSYSFASAGARTLYAWAKDAADNVSATSVSNTVTITLIPNTITITTAAYVTKTKTLTVYATSSYGITANLELQDYGPMTWNKARSRWEKVVKGILPPATVTVFGPEGSRTATVTVK